MPFGVLLLPQLAVNANAGHGWRLAANDWWNLELGLVAQHPRDYGTINQRYWGAAPGFVGREELARQRTLAHLDEVGLPSVVGAQLRKLSDLAFEQPSSLETSLNLQRRWGEEPPKWLDAFRLPGRFSWYLLLALGGVGWGLTLRRDAAWTFLGLFTALFAVALFAVPVKVRFALPLLPVLALYAGAALEWAAVLTHRTRARYGA